MPKEKKRCCRTPRGQYKSAEERSNAENIDLGAAGEAKKVVVVNENGEIVDFEQLFADLIDAVKGK